MEFDNFKERYTALVNDSIRFSGLTVEFFTWAKARHLIEAAANSFGDPSRLRLLDIGCGLGSMHPHLVKAFGPITGVDIAAETVELARKANPGVRYQSYDGRNLPFEDASFDVVLAVCVLHHVPPPEWPQFVEEMTRVTARRGMVAVFEHNPLNPLTRHVVSRCELDRDAVLLSAPRVKRLLRQAGLAQVRSRYIIFAPLQGRAAAFLDKTLGWLPAGAQYFVAGAKA